MGTSASALAALARREVARHPQRYVGVTCSKPVYQLIDGLQTFVVDVRIGVRQMAAIVKRVPIASTAAGVVTDMNLPVLVERSEAGQLTVIGRSVVLLPDIHAQTFTLHELGLDFMIRCEQDDDGMWRDGFGHAVTDPETTAGVGKTYRHKVEHPPLDAITLGTMDLGATIAHWTVEDD